MRLIITGASYTALPYAVSVDAESLEDAAATAISMRHSKGFIPQFVFDVDGGQVFRITTPAESLESEYSGPELVVTDSAYEVVGINTPEDYFNGYEPIAEFSDDC
jgi:hypothetical protein